MVSGLRFVAQLTGVILEWLFTEPHKSALRALASVQRGIRVKV